MWVGSSAEYERVHLLVIISCIRFRKVLIGELPTLSFVRALELMTQLPCSGIVHN
jgi:hypothetical protein